MCTPHVPLDFWLYTLAYLRHAPCLVMPLRHGYVQTDRESLQSSIPVVCNREQSG